MSNIHDIWAINMFSVGNSRNVLEIIMLNGCDQSRESNKKGKKEISIVINTPKSCV